MLLKDLFQKDESAIEAASTLLGQKMITLDCTGVESLTPTQLTGLFSDIPQGWNLAELNEVFDSTTLTPSFSTQLNQLIAQRLGIEIITANHELVSTTGDFRTLSNSISLDIFNLRDEVISDYRRYIKSFLKIREPRVEKFVELELERGKL